ncbi:gastrula zinc finger protein XlCGF57.1 [Anabrus simplex]|uniref:gastrula zinc finger protein XlCGF57.1 n=1 Tax=Anabrus simplex TaxID=316456 RepID=UPI0035A3D457
MAEPVFIKCEPDWLSDVEEPSTLEVASDNIVERKIEPTVVIDNPSGGEDEEENKDVFKEEVEFQETHLELSSDNVDDIGKKQDIERVVIKVEETDTELYYNEEETAGTGGAESLQSNAEQIKSMLQVMTSSAATEKNYPCEICHKKFASPVRLRVHQLVHSDPHVCQHCGKKFSHSGNFRTHLSTHATERPFACTLCDKTFAWEPYLKKHMKQHSTEKPHVCQLCLKSFHTWMSLRSHMNIHIKEKLYSCPHCDSKFAKQYNVRRHLLTHIGEKRFECNQCDRRFTRMCELRQHLLTHTDEKPYVCNECGKSFRRKNSLSEHVLLHTGGKRKHLCRVCNKDFSHRSRLAFHLLTHIKEPPFTCLLCGKCFDDRLEELEEHMKKGCNK